MCAEILGIVSFELTLQVEIAFSWGVLTCRNNLFKLR